MPHAGEVGALEGLAAIGAAIDAVGGAGEHDVRVGRVDADRVGLMIGQHMLPPAGFRLAGEDPTRSLLIAAADIAGHPGIDV